MIKPPLNHHFPWFFHSYAIPHHMPYATFLGICGPFRQHAVLDAPSRVGVSVFFEAWTWKSNFLWRFLAGKIIHLWWMFHCYVWVPEGIFWSKLTNEQGSKPLLVDDKFRDYVATVVGITVQGGTPLVISWFITQSNYSYSYHKPWLL